MARIARRDSSGNVFYYLADHLGTSHVIAQVPSGQTTASLCYDANFEPFGGEHAYTNTCPQNYKFTGKERDSESNLDNFGARYYTSTTGRFMTPDWALKPVTVPYANFGDPQTLNLYTYVENSPLNRVDPDGHTWANSPASTSDNTVVTKCTEGGCASEPPMAAQNQANQAQNQGSDPQHKLSAANWTIVDDFSGGSGPSPAVVSYDKNVPPMTDETKQYIEQTATNAGLLSINISATTNGEHAPNSYYYNGTAVDINIVNGGRVRTSGTDPEVARHVGWLQEIVASSKSKP